MRFVRIVVLAWMAAACMQWQGAVVPRVLRDSAPSHSYLRLHFRDGTQRVIYRPSIRTDSIVGFDTSNRDHLRLAFPVEHVAAVQTGETSAGRTVLLVVGVVGLGSLTLPILFWIVTNGASSR